MALTRFVSTLHIHCSHRPFVCISRFFLCVFYRKSRVVCAAQDYCCYRRAGEINRITGDKNRWRRDEHKQNKCESERTSTGDGFIRCTSEKRRFHVLIHALYLLPRLQHFGNHFGEFLCSSRTHCRCATWMTAFCLLCLCIRIHQQMIHEV